MARFFLAIAATTVLVVAVMALLVAASMRDGFARYLLRGELVRFDSLLDALVLNYDPAAPGWPDLAAHPRAWNDFVRANFTTPGSVPPPDGPLPPPQPPLDAGSTEAAESRPERPPPPAGGAFGDGLQLAERLSLLGPDGASLAGPGAESGLVERRPICAGDCANSLLGYLQLTAPAGVEDAGDRFFLRGQYASLALSAVVALALSAAVAALVARRLQIPIRQLADGARTMAAGDYTTRIAQSRTDELGQLIGHYNVLAATLERTDKAEREWISNTSHELQTPLAVLRAQIEAVQDGVRRPDAATLGAMHAATMRLSRLVGDIKTLSHGREGGLALFLRTEDLGDIAREAADTVQAAFAAKGIALDIDVPNGVPVTCDRARIGQVIDNLLQNALRYTQVPGRVRLQVRAEDKGASLIIDDTPPAPAEADMARLFDRFFRAESSRSRVHGGSGLGLSVCRALVVAHGGTIEAGPSDFGGLRMTVNLPKGTP